MYWLYNIFVLLLSPFWFTWMWLRARKRKEQPNWKERQGAFDLPARKDGKRIWFHAVSVGEVVAAMPILRELRSQLPDHEIVLSVTTSSGHQTAREKAEGLYDHLVYFPIDVARFQLSAMQKVRPSVVAVMETELWFNFLWAAKIFDVRTLLINGRISDRSFPRSRRIAFFYKALLKYVDRCLMQSEVDADRIKALGAAEVEVLGNCKFDQAMEGLDVDAAKLRQELGLVPDLPVIVVGSTRGDAEEDFVLKALVEVGLEKVQVIHAPRHLESVPGLVEKARSWKAEVGLRSAGHPARYLVLDTYGELAKIYAVADVVIIGGGFDNLGGQNLLQPLAHGKSVLHGPHMQNFREVTEAAGQAGAAWTCDTPEKLAGDIRLLLGDEALREKMGKAAKELIAQNAGASRRYAEAIAAEAKRK